MNPRCRLALVWLGIPLMMGGAAHVVSRALTSPERRQTDQPVLEATEEANLGELEAGREVDRSVTFANHGGADLVVDNIRTTCSCTALQTDEDGKTVNVTSLRLRPGAVSTVNLHVTARGRPGVSVDVPVTFNSNDPEKPTGAIHVVITKILGGIYTTPEAVVFGEIPVGGEGRRVVTIIDYISPARTVVQVVSTKPDVFAVRLLPLDFDGPGSGNAGETEHVAGRLEVVLTGKQVGSFQGDIEIHLADRPGRPDVIRALGRVVGLAEISPANAVIPRTTGSGLSFQVRCVCRSTDGRPLTLALDPVPMGLDVSILEPELKAPVKIVQITWHPEQSNSGVATTRYVVRLRAKIGDQEMGMEIPVICRGEERIQ